MDPKYRRLEIGCGCNPQPGYIHSECHIDSDNRPFVDLCCCADALPFCDNSLGSILMFGVFEHFGIFEIQKVMLEVVRTLRKGGTFKFDVPDFDWFVAQYLDKCRQLDPTRTEEWCLKSIFGGQNGPGMFHKWGWNGKRLKEFLMKPNWNFSEVRFLGKQWRDPEENHLIWECVK